MNNGTINQPSGGNIVLNGGTFTWKGGSINDTGTLANLRVAYGATLSTASAPSKLGDNLYVDRQSKVLFAHLGFLTVTNGGKFTNFGVIDFASGGPRNSLGLKRSVNTSVLDNYATIYRDTSGGEFTSDLPIYNHFSTSAPALIWISAGTLHITQSYTGKGASIYQEDGETEINAQTALDLDYGYTQGPGNGGNGGTLYINGDNTQINLNDVDINGGTVDMGSPSGYLDVQHSFNMTAGTFDAYVQAPTGPRSELVCNAASLAGTLTVNTSNPPPTNGTMFDIIVTDLANPFKGDFQTKNVTYTGGHYNTSFVSDATTNRYRLTAVNGGLDPILGALAADNLIAVATSKSNPDGVKGLLVGANSNWPRHVMLIPADDRKPSVDIIDYLFSSSALRESNQDIMVSEVPITGSHTFWLFNSR